MTMTSFRTLDELKDFFKQSTFEEFKNHLCFLSFAEISHGFLILQNHPTLLSNQKLNELFQFINVTESLEKLGKILNEATFIRVLDFLQTHPLFHSRLSFILTGISPSIFSKSLKYLEEEHLNLMKHESLLEPLQYHLTLFIHEGESLLMKLDQQIISLMNEIRSLKKEDLTEYLLSQFEAKINGLKEQLLEYLETLNKALTIVWYTNRMDLIEKISQMNESFHHELFHLIGHPNTAESQATGIYALLSQSFSQIFEELADQDAALEGLTRLSIWHLKDYWNLGLLPDIQKLQDIDLNAETTTEEQRHAHHQALLSQVQQHLHFLKIGTIGELKNAHIYSRSSLLHYIKDHQHLLFH